MGRLVYLFVQFVGNIQTSPNKKKVSHVNIFSAKMTGIYVITYKAGGFYAKNMGIFVITYNVRGVSAKNMPCWHLTGGPRRSDSGLARAKRAFSRLGSFLPRFRKNLIAFRTKS